MTEYSQCPFTLRRQRHNFYYFGKIMQWVLHPILTATPIEKCALTLTLSLRAKCEWNLICSRKTKNIPLPYSAIKFITHSVHSRVLGNVGEMIYAHDNLWLKSKFTQEYTPS